MARSTIGQRQVTRFGPPAAAADPSTSAWVTANAGSGKTHTLTDRVTRLLLGGAAPGRILCLTYTKAAAAEMQSRLFGRLGSYSMLPDRKLRCMLDRIGANEISDLAAARRLFAQALETPGGLKIQTIHGFCQSLLTLFPLEAGVAPGFSVLDEPAATNLMNEARVRMLERAGKGGTVLSTALSRLVTEITEQRLDEILQSSLGSDRRRLMRFLASPMVAGGLEQHVRVTHGIAGTDTEDSLTEHFCATLSADRGILEEIADWLDGGLTSDRQKSGQLRRALAAKSARVMFQHLRSAFLKSDGEAYQRLVTSRLQDTNDRLSGYLQAFVERLYACDLQRNAANAASLCHSILVVAQSVHDEYALLKNARAALDYDDLVLETRHLLEQSAAAQWVLFKLDGGIDHVLIDEAQDTSPDQWTIVRALTEEFFAGSGIRRDSTVRTIFAVGDEKQSIFSFQGAEPDQFEAFRLYFEERVLGAGHEFSNTPLVVSRRSTPEILAFVDEVFRPREAREGLTSQRVPIEHVAERAGVPGRVEFWPAIVDDNPSDTDPDREMNLPQTSAASRLAERIAGLIGQWLAQKTNLPGRGRPIAPSDIMILLPRREPFGPLIIRALKDRSIPVSGADRMRLTDELSVQDLIALGRFVLQPMDDLTLATLLRSPFCDVSEEELLELCSGRPGRLWDRLRDFSEKAAAFKNAHIFLSEMLSLADFTPPFEFYAHALTALGMRERLLRRLGSESEEAIDEFLSLTLSHEPSATASLEGWLKWMESGGAEIRRDMERVRNEVRVMTVHGAKGLEADIVFLPDTTSLPMTPSQRGTLLFTGDAVFAPGGNAGRVPPVAAARAEAHRVALREYRRLLYVAMTRARDRLYICGFAGKSGIKHGSWYRLAEAAAEKLGRRIERDGQAILAIGAHEEDRSRAPAAQEPGLSIPSWAVTSPPAEPPSATVLRPAGIESE
ncbi:MAG: double-strand break repair helicase AddA, partial [Alphaproteobacteria bacterium]|nr:double-strand break repair helicase AddA [Alphaproteobacteria bacterium]